MPLSCWPALRERAEDIPDLVRHFFKRAEQEGLQSKHISSGGVELMKRYFRCNYADHRMCASMIGNAVVYTALSVPGDLIMSAAQPVGGHSSNRLDGPAGAMGRKIVDIPVDPHELVVDIDAFRTVALAVRPPRNSNQGT